MTDKCTCLTELEDDGYSPGGPMSGHPKPPPCVVHSVQKQPSPLPKLFDNRNDMFEHMFGRAIGGFKLLRDCAEIEPDNLKQAKRMLTALRNMADNSVTAASRDLATIKKHREYIENRIKTEGHPYE